MVIANGVLAQTIDSTKEITLKECWISNLPTDRPGQSYNPQTLFKNQWQIQAGTSWGTFYNLKRGRDINVTAFPVDIRYGITHRLELMFSPSFGFGTVPGGGGIEYTLSSYSGNLRYSIFRDRPYGSLGVLATYEYATYESGLETANAYKIKAMYSVGFSNLVTFTSNLGFGSISSGPNFIPYTVNLSFAILPKLGFYVEAYGDINLSDLENVDNPFYYDAGLYYLPNANLQFDAGYNRGGTSSFTDDFVFIGISYRFGFYKKS